MDTYARYQALQSLPHKKIGKSLFGRELCAFFAGNPTVRPVIVQSAIHAREWVSAEVCMNLFLLASTLPLKGGYWFLPVANPDGVLLSTRGVSTAPALQVKKLIEINNGADFSLWKANGRGVDLNVNFCARHGQGKSNAKAPAPENYVGAYPESEPCTRALVRFTRSVCPVATFSLHTKGGEVYWQFLGKDPENPKDHKAAFQLYGGDLNMRIQHLNPAGIIMEKDKVYGDGTSDYKLFD